MRENEVEHRRVDEGKLSRAADGAARTKRALFIEPARDNAPRFDAFDSMRKSEGVREFFLDEFPDLLGVQNELIHSEFTFAIDARMGRIARLMPWVRRLVCSVTPRDAEEHLFIEDEILALSRCGNMKPGVHADRIYRTRLDAIATENAAKLVDDENLRIALVTVARIVRLVFGRLDMNALRGADGAAAEASHASGRTILTLSQAVHAAKTLRIFAPLLGIQNRGGLGLVFGSEGVFDEALKRHREAGCHRGHIDLRRDSALRLLEDFDRDSHGSAFHEKEDEEAGEGDIRERDRDDAFPAHIHDLIEAEARERPPDK